MKNSSGRGQGLIAGTIDHLGHIQALGYKAKDALAQLVREIAFTHLNRLCAYKMMEAREVWVGGTAVSGSRQPGHEVARASSSTSPITPRTRSCSTPGTRTWPIAISWAGWVACSPRRSASCSRPPTRPTGSFRRSGCWTTFSPCSTATTSTDIWAEDETIGWVYQYFTPKELRDQVRKESAAPRNSYELAFRNQFFTPRYVVEFLTDNTLGRIWYEMRKGDTKLKDQCRYMVRRPSEVFLAEGQTTAKDADARTRMICRRKNFSSSRSTSRTGPRKTLGSFASSIRPAAAATSLLYCFDSAPHDLRGSLRRSRPRPEAEGRLPDAGCPAAGCASA